MKCYEIIEKLETLAPVRYAEEWDNVGLLAGRRDKEVNTIYIALDASDDIITEAVHMGADMLLTHHPLIFRKLGRVNTDDFIGRRIVTLIQKDISYYAMHTNFDVMGMADAAADALSLTDRSVLNITFEDKNITEGCGRVGQLPKRLSVAECAAFVKECFQVPHVKVFGDLEHFVEKAAVMPGSGGSYIQDAFKAGAEIMITGDIDHHKGIDAVAQGLTIIDAGHYGIEKLFIPYMEAILKEQLTGVRVCKADFKEPFVVI